MEPLELPMLVGGAPRTTEAWIDVDDPATTHVIGRVPHGGAADVRAATAHAAAAFEQWRWVAAGDRADLLHGVAQRMRDHADDLIELLTREEGKPRVENEEEVLWAASTFDYYAGLARHERGRVIPSGEPETQLNLVLREPYGVVAAIVPWNYPLLLAAWKVAPALAAGNTVVLKPSELTPLSTLVWVERCMAHLPPGVVQVVTGLGPDVGEALVADPAVRVVAFTGSVATGQRIASVAAPQMKHLHLELGGKDAFVVGPDADLATAVDAVAYAALLNAGQVCTSAERIYVPRAREGEFVDALVATVERLRLGHGLEPGTDLGPLIGDRYRAKVQAQLDDATRRGARIVTGGGVPAELEPGSFLRPAVVTGVDHAMPIMREETFGPVLPVMPYRDFDEAIALANDTDYGLGATLRSSDPALVKRFFERVKAGTVWINDPLTDNAAGPFGGMKMTGGGRELGVEGLESFTEVKHVHWDLSQSRKDWWFPYGEG